MLEKECLEWALNDLVEAGSVRFFALEQALHLMAHLAGEAILVSRDDGRTIVLPETSKTEAGELDHA